MLKHITFSLLFLGMMFAQETKIPDYSTTERSKIPVEYTWNIQDIYKTEADWRADFNLTAALLKDIDILKSDWLSSSDKMLKMLKLSDEIYMKLSRLYDYASNQYNAEMDNAHLSSIKGEVQNLYVEAGAKFNFFSDDLIKVDPKTIDKFVKENKELKVYDFYISQVLRAKQHILPADQQKIVTLTGLYTDNFNQAFNLLNDVELPSPTLKLSDGKEVTLNYANYMLYRASKNAEDRSNAMRTFWNNHKKFENTFACLLDAQMKIHLFYAKTNNYSSTLQARLFGDDIDTAVYYNLIKYVKANLSPFHRYLKLKKELLGLKEFKYEDIYASAVKNVDKSFSFNEAKNLVYSSLKPLGEDYKHKLDQAFSERWIDIYPNKSKQSGAYSSGVYGVHPYVKLNYNGEYDAVSTLIHELGHSMHSYYTNSTQPYAYSGYTTFIAEIASTFNESMLINYMAENEKDDLFKLYLLDSYMSGIRGTIFRQCLFAEFELEMHKQVEKGNTVTPQFADSVYLALTREYYGHDKGVTKVDDYISNEWGAIPHFFMNYYVFQYSTGMIASMALSNAVLTKQPNALDKYITLLKSGANDYPINLLKKAGVDMTSPDPYKAAFERMDKIVTEMEQIAAKLKKENKL